MNFQINQFKSDIKELNSRNVELKSENEELKVQLSQQDKKIIKQDQKIFQLEKDISKQKSFGPSNKPTDSCVKKLANAASKKNEKSLPRVDLDLLPTSCDELQKEGHFANGVYLVLNEETKRIDAVLCQFLGARQGKMGNELY